MYQPSRTLLQMHTMNQTRFRREKAKRLAEKNLRPLGDGCLPLKPPLAVWPAN